MEPVNTVSATLPVDQGQLSPVYIEDPGESHDYEEQSLTSEAVTVISTDSAVLPDGMVMCILLIYNGVL